ncbi:MAG TPA: cation-translocating P-type ATPase [Rhodanobacteraceae bacterium]
MSTDNTLWARPALAAQVLAPRRDGRSDVLLRVPALADARRTVMLQSTLEALPGVTRVRVEVTARRLHITFDAARIGLPDLLDACHASACPAQPLRRELLDDPLHHQANDALKRLAVAGLFTMQAMMFALVLYLGVIDRVDASTRQLFRWLEMLAATPVIGYAAIPFFRHALRDLRARRAGIDVPIAIAVLLIYLASAWNTLAGHGAIWFDSATMLIFVLLTGRYLELRARRRHHDLDAASTDNLPLLATRRDAAGTWETVAALELEPGDRLRVSEGSVVPADGILACAQARLDTSHHDGESRVRHVDQGQPVESGSLVLDAPIELTVTRAGSATSATRRRQLAEEAARQRARTDGAADAGVGRFIAGVLGLAAATAAFWLWHDPARAFDTVIAVLVVACPCAFALATPATLTRAMSVLARRGVMLTRPQALAALADVDHALVDKTGTLTRPQLDAAATLTHNNIEPRQALAWAAALAHGSSHPVAQAVLRANAATPATASDIQVSAGGGISGRLDGRALRLGRAGFACPGHADDDALWLADAHGPLARFALVESLRPGARSAMQALQQAGIHVAIASGDSAPRVAAIAAQLDIADHHARQSPDAKFERVRAAQAAGHRVLVVGDGSNDAAALAAADVSASLAGATDLARHHADLLLGDDLSQLTLARALARRAVRTMRHNRRWGLTWNAIAIPLAACGLVPPWLAALGMSASSLIVVLNALRLEAPDAPPAAGPHHDQPARWQERTA